MIVSQCLHAPPRASLMELGFVHRARMRASHVRTCSSPEDTFLRRNRYIRVTCSASSVLPARTEGKDLGDGRLSVVDGQTSSIRSDTYNHIRAVSFPPSGCFPATFPQSPQAHASYMLRGCSEVKGGEMLGSGSSMVIYVIHNVTNTVSSFGTI